MPRFVRPGSRLGSLDGRVTMGDRTRVFAGVATLETFEDLATGNGEEGTGIGIGSGVGSFAGSEDFV
jgi:hypothetical protein